jgi:hypothetical protein
MVTIPGVGHSPHLERPDEFAALLKDFVVKHAPVTNSVSHKMATPRWMQLKKTIVRWLRIQ